MRTAIFACLSILLIVSSGCSTGKSKKRGVAKTFYGRTIEFNVEPEAKERLSKLELLMCRAHEVEHPVPDKMILPMYRDADIDRDHFITKDEAEVYYQDFIIKFEDSLGAVQYQHKKADAD